MKKYIILLLLLFISTFVFNLKCVYADELETQEVEDEKTEEVVQKEEPTEEKEEPVIVETPKNEAPKEEIVEENPSNNKVEETPVEEEQPKEEVVEEVQPKEEVVEEEQPKEEVVEEEVQEVVNTEVATGKQEEENNTNVVTEPVSAPVETTTDTNKEDDGVPVQKAKVIFSKVNEDGERVKGALLQVFDSKGNLVVEWISSDTEDFEYRLPAGTYTLHEEKEPDGYEKADDKEFTVDVVVPIGYQADTEYPNIPCEAATTYYVEIEGKKYEVYCINQYLAEPGEDANYNGIILQPGDIRNYTKQVTLKDPYKNTDANYQELHDRYPEYITSGHGHLTDGPVDVSDQTLDDDELYNKVLDIIYRRNLVKDYDQFKDIPDEAISYITETALKNYTNAGITQIQGFRTQQPGDDALNEKDGAYYWYLMHMYKDYVYDPSAPNGWRVDIGHGDSLGNFARHWANSKPLHETKNLSVDHPEYAELYYFLLGDETSINLTHPEGMNIYIYTALNKPEEDDGYQNLLGITGYLDIEPKEVKVELVNEYNNDEKRDIPVEKIWDDKGNAARIRPDKVTIHLYADDEIVDTVEISAENDWKHTFKDLPKYNKGKLIQYTVDEVELDEYFYIIEGDMDEGFYVININYGRGGDNPPTGDNIIEYVLMLVVSLIGFIKLKKLYNCL